MLKREKKNFIERIFESPKFLTLIGLIIVVLIAISLAKNMNKRYLAQQEMNQLEEEISKLENKNSELKNLIEYFESDQFIEEKARLNLGFKKRGENVVVISDIYEDRFEKMNNGNEKKEKEYFTNPQKWWRHFFENNR